MVAPLKGEFAHVESIRAWETISANQMISINPLKVYNIHYAQNQNLQIGLPPLKVNNFIFLSCKELVHVHIRSAYAVRCFFRFSVT